MQDPFINRKKPLPKLTYREIDAWLEAYIHAGLKSFGRFYRGVRRLFQKFKLRGLARTSNELASEALTMGLVGLLFMLTLGVPLFRALLPASSPVSAEQQHLDPIDEDDYRPLLRRDNTGQLATALLLAVLAVGAALGLSQLLATDGEGNSAVLIVAITTLGIALSLHRRVRGLTLSYRLGMYLIYVFCIAVSSMVSFEELLQLDRTVGGHRDAIFTLKSFF